MTVPDPVRLPALGLPPEALRSLRKAFSREVAVRLPRLLNAVQGAGGAGPLALARNDATLLAEGCDLLGDAAGARALRRLGELLEEGQDSQARRESAATAALLLGRWTGRPDED